MSLLAQTLCKIREDEEQVLLVALYCPNRTWFTELMLVATAPPGRFLWGRIWFLRDGAPSGTHVQICGNFMCGPWTGRGCSRWPAPGGSSQKAFSVNKSCLEFGPADSSATLRPRPGYMPKVPTTPFRDQVVNLQALPLEEADPALAFICPVHALWQYEDRTPQDRALGPQNSSLSVTEDSRRGRLSPRRGWPTG